MAQAAANLAGLFAPPSGAEASGWASARAKQEEASRIQWLFDNFGDPSASQRSALTGVQGYGQTPEGFRYNVDEGNTTQRYGVDVGARTSMSNNAADNARALQERGMMEDGLMERLGITDATSRYDIDQRTGAQVYGHDTQAATSRFNNAADNTRALQTNVLDNQARTIGTLFGPLNPGQVRPEVSQDFMDALQLPDVPAAAGAPKPLSETEWTAQQNQRLLDSGQLTDDVLMDALMGEQTPVKAIGGDGQPAFMSPGAAVRQSAQPYEAQSAERVDNYLAVGPNGEEVRFPGMVGPNGQIINTNDGQVVPNVIRKEGTGGGMSFEVDGQGGVRFTTGGAGNTVSQQTNLQGQRDAATQSAQELQTLFDNITASDVGFAGNLNDFLTNYGAQVFPDVARGDVTAMRTQLQAATMRLARSLSGDSRISESDRQTAREINAGVGFGESLPGAKSKLAALTVLHAYRAKFAASLADGGEALPPINRAVVGELVDDGAISPALAQTYVETMLSSSRGGPTQMPGSRPAPVTQAAPSAAPAGVDPAEWEYLTPEERALFQ